MANDLVFLKGLSTAWSGVLKDPNTFYVVQYGEDGSVTKYELYLGDKLIGDGTSIDNVNTLLENYIKKGELPIASSEVLGGVKVGAGLTITPEGVLSATGGGVADSVDWNNITSKPETFKPEAHQHVTADITDLQDKLDGKVDDSDIADMLTKTEASSTYQPIGDYLTEIPEEYITESELTAKDYATNTDLNDGLSAKADKTAIADMLTKTEASSTYQPKGDYALKSDIPEEYTLPIASSEALGGVKVGAGLTITPEGVLSATGGGVADSVDWNNITSKPETFPPSEHTHVTADITDLQEKLDGKVDEDTYSADKATFALKSEIPDVSNFITNSVDNLVNYYKKSETYTKGEVDAKISAIKSLKIESVAELPSSGETDTIYLVPNAKQGEKNVKDEYIWVDGKWEIIGNTEIDLSGYLTKDEASSTYVTKETAASYITVDVSNLTNYYTKSASDGKYATKSDVSNKQDKLKSGVNIKTIDSQSLLGSGNITTLQLGTSSGTAFEGDKGQALEGWKDSLSSADVVTGMSFSQNTSDVELGYQGIYLSDGSGSGYGRTTLSAATQSTAGVMTASDKTKLDSLENVDTSNFATKDELNDKQDTLISGTNLKTIDGETLLGSGNIETLQIGETSTTAFQGDKGKSLEDWKNYLSSTADENIGVGVMSTDATISASTENVALKIRSFYVGDDKPSLQDGSIAIPKCTTSSAGVMTASDKSTLDRLNAINHNQYLKGVDVYGGSLKLTGVERDMCPSYSGDVNLRCVNSILGGEIICSLKGDDDIRVYGCNTSSGVPAIHFGLNGSLIGEASIGSTYGEIFNDYANNVASGDYSHAEGQRNTVKGGNAHAEGYGNTIETNAAEGHAEGANNTVTAMNAHAEGGNNKATGAASHVEGAGNTASGSCSHAEGNTTIASGRYSHAEGNLTTASGPYSHVEGYQSKALGSASHAEGSSRTGSGTSYQHAEGFNCDANGFASHAGGEASKSESRASFAHGLNLIANSVADYLPQFVIGRNNAEAKTAIFIVGMGEQTTSRHNAMEVHSDGTIKVKKLPVTGATYALMSDTEDDGMIDLQKALMASTASLVYNSPSTISARSAVLDEKPIMINSDIANHYLDLSAPWELAFENGMSNSLHYTIVVHNANDGSITITIPNDYIVFGSEKSFELLPDKYAELTCYQINGKMFAKYILN